MTAQPAVAYDVVYVRQPRYGDAVNTVWPEVFHPARLEPGADLVLLHPDGSEEVLVAGGDGAVTCAGADVFRIHVESRAVERLIFGELTPNTGAGRWDETDPVNAPPATSRCGRPPCLDPVP